MFRYIIVYYEKRKFGNKNLVMYPVAKEYFFTEDHYRELYDKWIPSSQALAEYRLINKRYSIAIVNSFRNEDYTQNVEDPYWCFYMTCLKTNPHRFKKTQYAKYQKRGLSGVMSRYMVLKGYQTPYFNNFVFPER